VDEESTYTDKGTHGQDLPTYWDGQGRIRMVVGQGWCMDGRVPLLVGRG
jgi:hypothetical protein